MCGTLEPDPYLEERHLWKSSPRHTRTNHRKRRKSLCGRENTESEDGGWNQGITDKMEGIRRTDLGTRRDNKGRRTRDDKKVPTKETKFAVLFLFVGVWFSTITSRLFFKGGVVTRTPGSQLPVPPGTSSFLDLPGRKEEDRVLSVDSRSPKENLV